MSGCAERLRRSNNPTDTRPLSARSGQRCAQAGSTPSLRISSLPQDGRSELAIYSFKASTYGTSSS